MTEPDPVETILKATGRRPPVDAARTERVREGAAAAWRAQVARRTRQRHAAWLAAAAVAATVAGIAIFGLRPAPAPSGVRVDRVTGVVSRGSETVHPGIEMTIGETIRTGPDSRAALRAASGHSVRVDVASALTVLSGTSFALERGTVYVDSGPVPAGASIRIATPFGTLEDRGTQFVAQLTATGLTVRVREGSVYVATRRDRVTVAAHEVVSIDPSGALARSALSSTDPSMAWPGDVAPVPAIDGKPLGEFLDWAARERGVTVRFADPALAKKARGIVLRGSIDGMTVEEAVDSVLATTGLGHRWEADGLIVTP